MVVAVEDLQIREIETRGTVLGPALYVKIHAPGHRPLSWREVWDAFADRYPGRWAVQAFPPADRLVDGKAVYHLFVLEEGVTPVGLDIR